MTDPSLNDDVKTLLEFERAHPRSNGRKHEAIRTTFGVAPAVYYRALAFAIDTEEALRHDAQLTHQIRDRMNGRTTRRTALLRRRTR